MGTYSQADKNNVFHRHPVRGQRWCLLKNNDDDQIISMTTMIIFDHNDHGVPPAGICVRNHHCLFHSLHCVRIWFHDDDYRPCFADYDVHVSSLSWWWLCETRPLWNLVFTTRAVFIPITNLKDKITVVTLLWLAVIVIFIQTLTMNHHHHRHHHHHH